MNRWSRMLSIPLVASVASIAPHAAQAAWPTDPLVNVPLCTATGYQDYPVTVPDGVGGAIIVWSDRRNDYDYDLYGQRVSAGGTPIWSPGGVPVCLATGNQIGQTIVSDGAGGVIVTWMDFRSGNSYDIYAQRISSAGTTRWATDGVPVCTADASQFYPTLAPDDAGGCIITWIDKRPGHNADIYAQRISSGGVPLWVPDGVAVCTAVRDQERPAIIADGAGGAIIAWPDPREPLNAIDLYAQRISGDGLPQWTADGVAICTAANAQTNPSMLPDGAGGAFVAWEDGRSGTTAKVYARRISDGGIPQWATDGVVLCTGVGYEWEPRMVPDGAGGAIVAWSDHRFTNFDSYAQRISAAGAILWAGTGVVLCNNIYGDQRFETIVPDGAGGAIVTWQDGRDVDYTGNHVYAQRVSAAGAIQWTAAGAAISTATGGQAYPTTCSDGAAGAIVAWFDTRNGLPDIYAQRVEPNGQLGGEGTVGVPSDASRSLALDPVSPNPARGGSLNVRFRLTSGHAAWLELFDPAGRRVAVREVGSLGAGPHALDLGDGHHLVAGLYLVRLRQGADVRTARVAVLE